MIDVWEDIRVVPPLGADEVHAWYVSLNLVSRQVPDLLSPDEQTRAQAYRFAADSHRFVSCRSTLRRMLGLYLDEAPDRLEFQYGPHGKPALKRNGSQRGISFNVSHSGDAALLAFTPQRSIGVDIENVNAQLDFENLARRFMAANEAASIRAAADMAREFCRCWTRKEAWMKAIGCGLEEPLSRFDTSSIGGNVHGAVACDDFPGSVWTIHELTPAPDLVGAVAIEGAECTSEQFYIHPRGSAPHKETLGG